MTESWCRRALWPRLDFQQECDLPTAAKLPIRNIICDHQQYNLGPGRTTPTQEEQPPPRTTKAALERGPRMLCMLFPRTITACLSPSRLPVLLQYLFTTVSSDRRTRKSLFITSDFRQDHTAWTRRLSEMRTPLHDQALSSCALTRLCSRRGRPLILGCLTQSKLLQPPLKVVLPATTVVTCVVYVSRRFLRNCSRRSGSSAERTLISWDKRRRGRERSCC